MNRVLRGFSLVEFLAGIAIATISGAAIMTGVSTIRLKTNLITNKEKAFEQLVNYTDFWKAKISAGEWESADDWEATDPFPLIKRDNETVKEARLYRKGERINGDDYPYPLYTLETKIVWSEQPTSSSSPVEKELNLKVYQIEFPLSK